MTHRWVFPILGCRDNTQLCTRIPGMRLLFGDDSLYTYVESVLSLEKNPKIRQDLIERTTKISTQIAQQGEYAKDTLSSKQFDELERQLALAAYSMSLHKADEISDW